jgi:hypothetical protein
MTSSYSWVVELLDDAYWITQLWDDKNTQEKEGPFPALAKEEYEYMRYCSG